MPLSLALKAHGCYNNMAVTVRYLLDCGAQPQIRSGWDNTKQDNRFVIAFGVSKNEIAWFCVNNYEKAPELFQAALNGDLKLVEAQGLHGGQEVGDRATLVLRRLGEATISNSSESADDTYLNQEDWKYDLAVSPSADVVDEHQVYRLSPSGGERNKIPEIIFGIILVRIA